MKSIEAILFDLGGVLIEINYSATIQEFKKLGFQNVSHLYSQSKQAPLFEQFEKGQISSANFINKLLAMSNESCNPNKIVKAWNAMIGDFSVESILTLKNLQNKYRLFLLSNTNELHINLVYQKWKEVQKIELASLFEKINLSHEIGMRKPDQETFLAICENSNIKPINTLFIDDSLQHIEGAKRAGLQTIHLKKITELASELDALGIN
ncbi:MAG: HAD family phosphatase [Bacteroidetes bacterium]|nr:HAD family phosphatase [Bacteroidota bacterium]